MRPLFHDLLSPDALSFLLFAAITLNFILLILYLFFNLSTLKNTFRISPKSISLAILIFLSGLCLRLFLSPFLHDDFYSEWKFMEAAQSMLLKGKYSICLFGDHTQCFRPTVVPRHPAGVPFILSISFLLFGVSDEVAIYTNILLGSVSVFLVFLLAYLLSGREDTGLYASFFFSLIPMHIRFSGTGILGPGSLFFQMVACVSFLLALRTNEKKAWALFLLSLCYTVQIRPETLIVITLYVAGYFLLKPAGLKKPNICWYHFAILFMLLPHLVHMTNGISLGSWKEGKDISSFSVDFAVRNFIPYGYFWLRTNYQLLIFPFLFLFGAFYLLKGNRNLFYFLSLWFGGFLLFFIPYHLDPVRSHTSFRYMLQSYVPFCLLMGFAPQYFRAYSSSKRILLGVLVLTVISFFPHIPRISYQDPLRVAEMEIMKEVEGQIEERCFVVGQTALFSIHKKLIYPNILLTDEGAFNEVREQTDCLYLFKDISTINDNWADRILSQCPNEVIASREAGIGPFGQVFPLAFYRIDLDRCPR